MPLRMGKSKATFIRHGERFFQIIICLLLYFKKDFHLVHLNRKAIKEKPITTIRLHLKNLILVEYKKDPGLSLEYYSQMEQWINIGTLHLKELRMNLQYL